MYHVCLMSMRTREHQISWNWNYRWLLVTMWVFGTESGPSELEPLNTESSLQSHNLYEFDEAIDPSTQIICIHVKTSPLVILGQYLKFFPVSLIIYKGYIF